MNVATHIKKVAHKLKVKDTEWRPCLSLSLLREQNLPIVFLPKVVNKSLDKLS